MKLSNKLEEEDEKAFKLSKAFKEFKREIARAAVNSRTGRVTSARVI